MSYKTHGLKYISLNPIKVRPEYAVWSSMKARCLNPKSQQYKNYGGRGIKVCERWMIFENFYADMGDRPSPQHSIGRKENDGNYDPDNCRWETKEEQDNNKRQNVFYTYNGQTKTLKQWADFAGLNIDTLWHRLNKSKMPFQEAILKKNKYTNSKKVDKAKAKEMLTNGATVAAVARHFKVTNKVITPIAIELGIAIDKTTVK